MRLDLAAHNDPQRPALSLRLHGQMATADAAGVLVLPELSLLAVADIHFEKASYFAAKGAGALLPPYDTADNIHRLTLAIEHYQPQTVICLGDSFHDDGAGKRLSQVDREGLQALCAGRNWIWITGNHDPKPPSDLGGHAVAEYGVAGLVFRHIPSPGPAPGEVAGHLHPKCSVRVRGRRLGGACFATDGARMVLPAFGTFTGGLDLRDKAFTSLFPAPFQALMLHGGRIRAIASGRLD